jgi:hypothetical protein
MPQSSAEKVKLGHYRPWKKVRKRNWLPTLSFWNIPGVFRATCTSLRSIMDADATSASGPARSRRAPPVAQRQRNASRYEA